MHLLEDEPAAGVRMRDLLAHVARTSSGVPRGRTSRVSQPPPQKVRRPPNRPSGARASMPAQEICTGFDHVQARVDQVVQQRLDPAARVQLHFDVGEFLGTRVHIRA